MALIDLYNKAKKKLSDVETNVGNYFKDDRTTGGIVRNTLSPKNVSQAILTAPKYTFADNVSWKNPIKKLGAETLQGTANTFLGVRDFSNEAADQYYGNKPADTKKLAGMGAKSALDLFTLGYGGGAAESLYKQGIKTVATGQIPKLSTQIVKNAAKMGRPSALIGGGYGAADSLEKGDSTKNIVLNTAKGGAMGYGLGSVLGGGSTAVGALNKAVRNDLAGNISKKMRFNDTPQVGTVSSQPIVGRYGQGANVKVPGFIDTVKSPFQTPQVARQIGEALPRPGMNIQDVSGRNPLLQEAGKYKSAEEFVKANDGKVVDFPTSALKQYIRPRGGRSYGELMSSIEKNGFDRSKPVSLMVFPDGKAVLADGNGRALAARDLGSESIPTRIVKSSFSSDTLPGAKPFNLTDLYNKAHGGTQSETARVLNSITESLPRPGMNIQKVGGLQDDKWFNALSEKEKMDVMGIKDDDIRIDFNPFGDEVDMQYQTFKDIFKNPKLRNPQVKERLMDGDQETLRRELVQRGVMSKADVDNMLYHGERNGDEMLETFKADLLKENPALIAGKKVANGLGLKGESVQEVIKKVNKVGSSLPQNRNNVGVETPEEVLRVLKGAETKQRGFISSVNDGQKTPEELRGQLSGDYAVLSDKARISNARKFIQENQQEAETRALNPQSAEDITIGNQLLDAYIANGQFDKVRSLTEAMAKSGTEMGQAVRSFADYDKTNPAGAVRWAQTKINQYNTKNPNNPLALSEQDIQSLMAKAKEVQVMPEGRMRNIEANNLMTQVNELIPSTITDKAITLWKAGLLTSLRTTARNVIGNTMHQIAEITKDLPATAADMVMAQKTGQRTVTPTIRGIGSGVKKGIVAAWDVMRHGYDPEENIQNFDLHKVTWGKSPIAQVGKFYTDMVFRSLSAQDKIFYNSSYARSMYDQAGAMAINAGKARNKDFIESLVANPNEEMIKNAIQDASVATFKNKNVLSNIASSIKQKAADIPGMGGEAGKLLTEVVLPFTGVPSSIAGQTIAYSPAGLLKGAFSMGKVLTKDIPSLQRQAAQEIGRGVLGTGLYGLGAYLVSEGLMTGQPKDANEALQWQLEGKQANSVMVDGKWRSINSIGPEALVMLAGGKIQEGAQSPDGFSAGSAVAGLAKDQMGQTFLSGVQQPLQAITDPARYGKSYTNNMAASIIPNIVKDTAKANDPYARETNNVGEAMKAGIPGLRNELLPKRDVLGNVIPQQPTGAAAFIDLFNSKTPIQNPVVDELSRLYKEGSDATPGKMKNTASVFGEKKKFSPEELDKIEAQTGVNLMPILENVVNSEDYKSLDDEAKQKLIKNTIENVRQGTKKEIVTGLPNQSDIGSTQKLGSAEIEMEKIKLSNSDENFKDLGDYVLRKNSDGNVTKQKKSAYEAQVSEATLTSLKKKKDVKGWLTEADKLYQNLNKQLQDPSLDGLEKIQLQNKIETLDEQFAKYRGYGGFTKGRSGGSKKDAYKSVGDSPSALIKSLQSKFSTKKVATKLPNFAKGGSQVTKRTRKRGRMITV